jgi:hypothetical protein
MAEDSFGGLVGVPSRQADDRDAYNEGYGRVMRELSWARARGWTPTERQLTVALMQAIKVYGAVRGGKFVGGKSPEWLRGRADALRAVIRKDAGATRDE